MATAWLVGGERTQRGDAGRNARPTRVRAGLARFHHTTQTGMQFKITNCLFLELSIYYFQTTVDWTTKNAESETGWGWAAVQFYANVAGRYADFWEKGHWQWLSRTESWLHAWVCDLISYSHVVDIIQWDNKYKALSECSINFIYNSIYHRLPTYLSTYLPI